MAPQLTLDCSVLEGEAQSAEIPSKLKDALSILIGAMCTYLVSARPRSPPAWAPLKTLQPAKAFTVPSFFSACAIW